MLVLSNLVGCSFDLAVVLGSVAVDVEVGGLDWV